MSSASLPVGAPPAFGPRIFQKKEWFQWPPPLLRTGPRMASGTDAQILDDLFERFGLERGVAGDGLVQIVHISLVMTVMMNFHGQRVKVRFERVLGVRQRR